MRFTLVSHANILIAPTIAWILCAPHYLRGTMSLGEVAQASAAFITVQTALNWVVSNYQHLAEWTASVNRVSALLLTWDQIDDAGEPPPWPPARVESRSARPAYRHLANSRRTASKLLTIEQFPYTSPVPRPDPDVAMVHRRPKTDQHARPPQILELQGRDVVADFEADRPHQERANGLGPMLQQPGQHIEDVIVGNRDEVVRAPSNHQNEQRTRGTPA